MNEKQMAKRNEEEVDQMMQDLPDLADLLEDVYDVADNMAATERDYFRAAQSVVNIWPADRKAAACRQMNVQGREMVAGHGLAWTLGYIFSK